MGMRQELTVVELACSYYSTSINGRCNPLERQGLQMHVRNTATEEADSRFGFSRSDQRVLACSVVVSRETTAGAGGSFL